MDPFTSIAVMSAALVFAPPTNRATWNAAGAPRIQTSYVVRPQSNSIDFGALNEPIFAELLSYKSFSDGWDGEGSLAPSATNIDAAIAFVEMLEPYLPTPGAMLSYDGQVGLYWNDPLMYIDINFEQDGTISIYSRDRRVVPNRESYSEKIDPKVVASLLPIVELLNPLKLVA